MPLCTSGLTAGCLTSGTLEAVSLLWSWPSAGCQDRAPDVIKKPSCKLVPDETWLPLEGEHLGTESASTGPGTCLKGCLACRRLTGLGTALDAETDAASTLGRATWAPCTEAGSGDRLLLAMRSAGLVLGTGADSIAKKVTLVGLVSSTKHTS